jgi:RNA polymerase sigma-70 factor, ECF subfamily
MHPAADGQAKITKILRRLSDGDSSAESELFTLCNDELRRLARVFLSREHPGHTLQPTALVNELYLKIAGSCGGFGDRAHFFRVAASAMRQILTDHARSRNAAKRGSGARRMDIDHVFLASEENLDDVLAIDEALNRFALVDPRAARIVEMNFFGGLTKEEIGILLDLSPRTVTRDWNAARRWLHAALEASG